MPNDQDTASPTFAVALRAGVEKVKEVATPEDAETLERVAQFAERMPPKEVIMERAAHLFISRLFGGK